jgi:hypothetical protein
MNRRAANAGLAQPVTHRPRINDDDVGKAIRQPQDQALYACPAPDITEVKRESLSAQQSQPGERRQRIQKRLDFHEQQHLRPVWGVGRAVDGDFAAWIAEQADCDEPAFWDLCLYDVQQAALIGGDEQRVEGLEAVLTVATWEKSVMALQADLLGAYAFGVRHVICRTGTPPLLGDYPNTGGIWDVDSVELIGLLRGMNQGRDRHGIPLAEPTAFVIGARVNPTAEDPEREVADTRRKVAAGVDFLISPPVFDIDGLERLLLHPPFRQPLDPGDRGGEVLPGPLLHDGVDRLVPGRRGRQGGHQLRGHRGIRSPQVLDHAQHGRRPPGAFRQALEPRHG